MKLRLRPIEIIVVGVLLLFLFPVVFVMEENGRAKREWTSYIQEHEAKGDTFDFRRLLPAPVPDDENFAQTPLFRPIYSGSYSYASELRTRFRILPNEKNQPSTGFWQNGRRMDFAEWQLALGSKSIDQALAEHSAILNEVSTAATKPFAVFPIDSGRPFRTNCLHREPLYQLAELLAFRGLVQLHANDVTGAFDSWRLLLRLEALERTEPTLNGSRVSGVSIHFSIQIAWEGILDHRWTDDQLATMQQEYAGLNLLPAFIRAVKLERAQFNFSVPFALKDPSLMISFPLKSPPWISTYLPFLAPALVYQNANTCNEFLETQILSAVDPAGRTIDTGHLDLFQSTLNWSQPYDQLVGGFASWLENSILWTAEIQTGINEAAVACALERYHLANSEYPETLNGVQPFFNERTIPGEVTSKGHPLIYRRTADGSYKLYSLGWDKANYGGYSPPKGWRCYGDWLWPSTAK